MWVNHISLDNFRNYEQAEVQLSKGINVLLGPNGQGKTNIVEAINFFSSLSSHRTVQDHPLIRAQHEAGVIRMRIERDARELLLEMQINRDSPKRAQLNRAAVKPREITAYFDSVMFAPEDLLIVRGEPAHRRRFIDTALVEQNPQLAALFSDYERVVKQRSALLKSLRSLQRNSQNQVSDHPSTLEVWNERLITLGTKIMFERQELIHRLSDPLAQAYRDLVGDDHAPALSLVSSFAQNDGDQPQSAGVKTASEIAEHFRIALTQAAERERDRGMTLIGPHRDDLLLELNHLPVKGYASHGETWSYVLALRLATAQLFRQESRGGDPVIILDDVFAELDQSRRERLLAAIHDFDQVIVTAAVDNDVPQHNQWNVIRIRSGTVESDPALPDEVNEGDVHVR